MRCNVVDTTAGHMKLLSETMRICDKNEIYITSKMKPLEALQHSCNVSDECKTILINNMPIAIYGKKAMGEKALVWLVGTDDIERHKKDFYKITRKQIKEYLKEHKVLLNYVYAGNQTSIDWLKKVGALFAEPQPFGVFNQDFMYFEMR